MGTDMRRSGRPYPETKIARVATGSAAPRRAELGRATRFSSLVAAHGHGGLIRYRGLRAVQTGVSQVARERQWPRDALSNRLQVGASWRPMSGEDHHSSAASVSALAASGRSGMSVDGPRPPPVGSVIRSAITVLPARENGSCPNRPSNYAEPPVPSKSDLLIRLVRLALGLLLVVGLRSLRRGRPGRAGRLPVGIVVGSGLVWSLTHRSLLPARRSVLVGQPVGGQD